MRSLVHSVLGVPLYVRIACSYLSHAFFLHARGREITRRYLDKTRVQYRSNFSLNCICNRQRIDTDMSFCRSSHAQTLHSALVDPKSALTGVSIRPSAWCRSRCISKRETVNVALRVTLRALTVMIL